VEKPDLKDQSLSFVFFLPIVSFTRHFEEIGLQCLARKSRYVEHYLECPLTDFKKACFQKKM